MAPGEAEPLRLGTLWAFENGEPIPTMQPGIEARFSEIEQDSIPQLAVTMADVSSLPAAQTVFDEIHTRFAGGRRCFSVWAGGGIAAYGWVSFEEEYVGELDLCLRLLPGEAYIWDCATTPAFRQKGLFSALLVFIVSQLFAGGTERIWIGADLDNTPSQRGIDRAGFRRVADILVKPGEPARQGWLEGYPGASENLVAAARRVLLGATSPAPPGIFPENFPRPSQT